MSDDRRRLRTILLRAPKAGLLVFAALTSFTVGACFNGLAADGLPCDNDAQCGPGVVCQDGYCGGLFSCADDSDIPGSQACDGQADCPDGDDEDFELCFGTDEDAFECESGVEVPESLICDGEAHCLDGSDEGYFCAGLDVNQCGGQDGDLAHELVASANGFAEPLKIEVANFAGMPGDDVLVASRGGDAVKLVFDLETDTPKELRLNDPDSFDGRTVVDFELGSVNGDQNSDIVVVAAGAGQGIGVYVLASDFPDPPALYGTVGTIPNVISPEVKGIELGRLDDNDFSDLVVIADSGSLSENGRIFVGIGSTTVPPAGSYFTPVLLDSTPLGYDTFLDSDMADIDGDGDDDLLVSGLEGTAGKLWIIKRNGIGETDWDPPTKLDLTMVAAEIALGNVRMALTPGVPGQAPPPDIAILDPVQGQIMLLPNMGGTFMPMGPMLPMLEGSGFSGLTFADINCDGNGDIIVGGDDPDGIRIYFGDDDGDVDETPLIYESDADPRGGFVLSQFDDDATPDIFHATNGGAAGSEVRVLATDTDEE